ncbi:Imm49 family immunity protein [Streptomyces cyaneofuscatus]|uniref:Imm49 family immunity protein n=1 Tax=Streptomyces cyaneofuscatus TaxID=66883 RepID=UPI0037F7B44D
MTTAIARHDLPAGPNAERLSEGLDEDLIEEIDDLETTAVLIDSALSSARLSLSARCVADPRASAIETWESTVNALQLGSALFAVTGARDSSVECRIKRKLRTIPATGPMSTADAGTWLSAVWLAVICRDEDRAKDIDGSIALGPLAIACLAYDAEFPLDNESDYLPKHLLQRTWLGEFPT